MCPRDFHRKGRQERIAFKKIHGIGRKPVTKDRSQRGGDVEAQSTLVRTSEVQPQVCRRTPTTLACREAVNVITAVRRMTAIDGFLRVDRS